MEEVPNIVQEILNNKAQVKIYAEATDEEILAYMSAMVPDAVAEATKMIVLAKQGKMIEALTARAVDAQEGESTAESADTPSIVEDSESSNG